jgi:hypothetical protein
VSYQPEDRYWTDYLRVALPVVGLLLMLGLFWYWASSVIGDDDSTQPTETPAVAVLVTQPVPTAAPTQAVSLPVETAAPTQAADVQPTEPPADGGTDPTADTSTGNGDAAGFQVGDVVVTNDGVNMRAGPSTDDQIVDEIAAGTELNVIGPSVEGGDYMWLEVQNPANGLEGYVADEFVDLAS